MSVAIKLHSIVEIVDAIDPDVMDPKMQGDDSMSKKSRGAKGRKWTNVKNANLSTWNCPGCGSAMSDLRDHYRREVNATRYGSPCGQCATQACKHCKRFNGHEVGCRNRRTQ
jgi:hypothetical protein